MTRARQTVGALSPTMRGAMLTGCAEVLTARALSDRGLVARGSGFRLRKTPLGKQIGAMLLDLHQMRKALVAIDGWLGRLRQGPVGLMVSPEGSGFSVHEVLTLARDEALRALACSRRWVP